LFLILGATTSASVGSSIAAEIELRVNPAARTTLQCSAMMNCCVW
jgi:hypothetical protein